MQWILYVCTVVQLIARQSVELGGVSVSASSDTDVDRRTRARAFRTCSHTSHIHEQQLRWYPHHHHHDHQTLCWQGNLILQPTLSVTIR